jgi:hypothetical protein
MRNNGLSYQAICDALNAQGTPTPAGRPRWGRSHVSRLVYTRAAREMAESAGGQSGVSP